MVLDARLHGGIMIETGYPFGQDGLDPVKHRAGFTAAGQLFSLMAVPARAFNKVAYFKVKLVSVGKNFVHLADVRVK